MDGSTAPLDPGTLKIVQSKAIELASAGLRVVAMASGPNPDALTFAGFQGMMDPPRPGVESAIARLSAGGIQVVMITGDSEQTAVAIAKQLGIRTSGGGAQGSRAGVLTGKEIDLLSQRQLTDRIGGVTVFARTTPRHKMAIIEAFQSRGAVVAMTGDGGKPKFYSSIPCSRLQSLFVAVNDAPALRMADIGVSMGRGGTDVAKEAADVILVDDNFATLLPAVEEGKGMFESSLTFDLDQVDLVSFLRFAGIFVNIQNFLCFQLSTAVAALSLITLSTAFGLPNPLNPMQVRRGLESVTPSLPSLTSHLPFSDPVHQRHHGRSSLAITRCRPCGPRRDETTTSTEERSYHHSATHVPCHLLSEYDHSRCPVRPREGTRRWK